MNLKKRDLEKKLHIKSINKHDIEKIFHHTKRIGKNLLLISYLYHTVVKYKPSIQIKT